MTAAVRWLMAAATRLDVQVVVGARDVDRNRHGADLADRLPGRDERHRRNDDLVTGSDVERSKRQTKRVQTAGHANGCGGAAVRSEFGFERSDRLAVDESR